MKIWGLTGGIASGKSTVSKMFARHGAEVINADQVYHSLIQPEHGVPSALVQRIATAFAQPELCRPDGSLDRQALARRVFSDHEARKLLESISHPAVAQRTQELFAAHAQQGVTHMIYDVPLLYEVNLEQRLPLPGVVVVWVPQAVQISRLMSRDHLDAQEAHNRLQAQLSLDEKRRRARWVVDNSGSLPATEAQVETIWKQMREV